MITANTWDAPADFFQLTAFTQSPAESRSYLKMVSDGIVSRFTADNTTNSCFESYFILMSLIDG
jgi:hypothetical protein